MGVLPEIFARAIVTDNSMADILLSPNARFAAMRDDVYGPYHIRLVDSEQIRNSSRDDMEFTNWAISPWWPNLIPSNEIWIDKASNPDERPFYIANALTQLKSLAHGDSVSVAYAKGKAVEQAERDKIDQCNKKYSLHDSDSDIYIKLYCTIQN